MQQQHMAAAWNASSTAELTHAGRSAMPSAPMRKEDAALEKRVRRHPRQPLYPRHQLRLYCLAAKLCGKGIGSEQWHRVTGISRPPNCCRAPHASAGTEQAT